MNTKSTNPSHLRDLPEMLETHDDPVFGRLSYVPPKPVLRREGEVFYLSQDYDLPACPDSVIDCLFAAARSHPERLAIAERVGGTWSGPNYRQLKDACESVAQALLNRGLKQGDRIAVLSRNSIIHAEIAFGAMMAGIVVATISPSYARLPEAFPRLQSTFAQASPKLFFVDDAKALCGALEKLDLTNCEVVSENPRSGDTDVAELTNTPVTDAVAVAHSKVGPETVAKILYTSGSTGNPKGVINTQGMMTSNLAMYQSVGMPVLQDHRKRLCWLPWHHTFGGNHILNDVLRTATTLYIDTGRPVAGADFERTIDALREVRPTNYSNVPLAYTMLVEAMETDPELAEAFFSNLTFLYYGGAGFPGETYQRLQKLAVAIRGNRIPLSGGFAMTETAPSAMNVHWPYDGIGRVGMPYPGVEAKLLPLGDDRYELRLRGPNVFPGYLNEPELNKGIFDDEGYFKTGDAMQFDELDNIANDLRYAGRVSEDFKLDSGTFVQVGAVRTGLNLECDGLVRDTVIAGEGRPYLAALVWLNDEARNRAVRVNDALIEPAPEDLEKLKRALAQWNADNAGSSRQVHVIAVLADPPDMSQNEIGDKGYINQRQVLRGRAQIVKSIYDGSRDDMMVFAKR